MTGMTPDDLLSLIFAHFLEDLSQRHLETLEVMLDFYRREVEREVAETGEVRPETWEREGRVLAEIERRSASAKRMIGG